MIKVAIFDDHKSRREALKILIDLQTGMKCIAEYEDCTELLEKLKVDLPDVVLMDINMPRVNGIEGVKLINQHFPGIYIIMQTIFDDDDNIFNCLLAGAHGYILKKASNEKIIDGILEVVDGGAPMTPSVARRVLNYFNKHSSKNNKDTFNLSKRELDILGALVRGLSHKMIADELSISVFTVNNHIKKIYQKLHVHSVSEAVATAIQRDIIR